MSEIHRYDARLVTDVCGNKDVIMRETYDGLFVRYEDHLAAMNELRENVAMMAQERDHLQELLRR